MGALRASSVSFSNLEKIRAPNINIIVFQKHFKSMLPFVVDVRNLEVGFDSGWLHRFAKRKTLARNM